MAWYEESFGEDYLDLYSHRSSDEADAHAAFVERLFGSRPRAVLDIACGAGRHTAALRRRGHRVLGVDLSLTLLAQAADLPRVAGDMRRQPFADASFDWVLNFFTSFGYFETERENFRVLEEIVRLLVPGGGFLIDLMNLEATLAGLHEYEVQQLGGREAEIRRWWDGENRRLNKRIRLTSADRRPPRVYLESVRGYTCEEVTIGLRWAGLEVSHLFGSFAGEPYDRDSERLIIVGRRPA